MFLFFPNSKKNLKKRKHRNIIRKVFMANIFKIFNKESMLKENKCLKYNMYISREIITLLCSEEIRM